MLRRRCAISDTYTTSNRFTKPEVGANDGTWGVLLNAGALDMVDEAISGYSAISVASGDVTLSANNGATDQSRKPVLKFTGSPGTDRTVTAPVGPHTYWLINGVGDASNILFKATGGSTVTIPAGFSAMVYTDGAAGAVIVFIAPTGGGLSLLATEGTVTAATTTNLATSASNRQSVTGNTTITSFGSAINISRIIRFTGVPLITYNATSLITPTGANIQAVPGDVATLNSDGSGNWRITSYAPFGGTLTHSNTGVSVTTSFTQVCTVTLTPGKWRVTGNAYYSAGANSSVSLAIGSTTASSTGTVAGQSLTIGAIISAAGVGGASLSGFDVTVTANTAYYLNCALSTNTDSVNGFLRAERIY